MINLLDFNRNRLAGCAVDDDIVKVVPYLSCYNDDVRFTTLSWSMCQKLF